MMTYKRLALSPAGRRLGDGGVEHPLGGGCVGLGARRVQGSSPRHVVAGRGDGRVIRDRSCQQRQTIRHQARPRVRVARGWSCPSAIARA